MNSNTSDINLLENQNVEFKQNWHEDYLRCIAGFANGRGGILYIGIDDKGIIKGLPDYKKLMEYLPNKIRDILGILVEVNLLRSEEMYYLELITTPYTVPISLRGNYYIRSGSTTQELKGNALMDFLLRKAGKTWDDVVELAATFEDIDSNSVNEFLLSAKKSGRLPEHENLSLPELFDKLRLTEEGKLKRAAIVLFGKDPGKFYRNLVVKIGRFGTSDHDLITQEVLEGNIIQLLLKVQQALDDKFFNKEISFEGFLRIEKSPYPQAALREIVLNALVHRDYMGANIQIRLYDYQFSCWNEGLLPRDISLESLRRKHSSRPRNSLIAEVTFKGGYIDAWGRGTLKIIDSCMEAGLPEPEIIEQDGGIQVSLFQDPYNEVTLKTLDINNRQIKAISHLRKNGVLTNSIYQQLNSVGKSMATVELQDLISKELLIQTGSKGRGSKYSLNKRPIIGQSKNTTNKN